MHELIHILGFSPSLSSFYVDENLNKLGIESVLTKKVIRGVERTLIKTPKVLEFAKKYFNCSELEGVEVEDQE